MPEFVLLCGIPSESPLAMVQAQLDGLGARYLMLSQRRFDASRVSLRVGGGVVGGEIETGGCIYDLADVTGAYIRLMDDQALPELTGEPDPSPRRAHARRWHDTIIRWSDVAPVRVVNRWSAMGSNSSKPFQAQVILRHGFQIPETLITSDPAEVEAFASRVGGVVFKSTSGVRSIVRELTDEDWPRLERIRWCPVQFQARLVGQNVRVHTVGGRVFATAIETGAVDYRYARRQTGVAAALTPVELPDDVAERCVRLAADLDLPFAGVDLLITPDAEVYCFEVNPSPAFSYYESHTGQPIAEALARYLSGR